MTVGELINLSHLTRGPRILIPFFTVLLLCLPLSNVDAQDKQKIPGKSKIEAVNKKIKAIYGTARLSSDPAVHKQVANELYLSALKEKDSPTKYALICEGIIFAESSGSLKLSIDLLSALNREYKIDTVDRFEKTVRKTISNTRGKQQLAANIASLEFGFYLAKKSGSWEIARMFLKIFGQNGTPAAKLKSSMREISSLERLSEKFKENINSVRRGDSSRPANEAVGQWYLQGLGNCKLAIPYLARGSDKTLRETALQELATDLSIPSEAYRQAMRWAKLIPKLPDSSQRALREHVYSLFAMSLKSESELEKRLFERSINEFMSSDPALVNLPESARMTFWKHGWVIGKYFDITWSDDSRAGAFEQLKIYPNGDCTFFIGNNFYPLKWTTLPDAFKLTRSDFIYSFQKGNGQRVTVKRLDPKTGQYITRHIRPIGENEP